MSTPREASPAEPMETTSTWQSVVDSNSTVDPPERSTEANVTRPSDNLGTQGTTDGPGDVQETSHATPSDFPQQPTTYHPHPGNGDTMPLQYSPYTIPTDNNDRYHYNLSSHTRPRSNSHNNTQIIHEGSYAHIPDGGLSGFTPINQYSSLVGFPQYYYRSPYVQPDGFGYIEPSDFEVSKEPLTE